jgi:nucleoid-associated protein YgaU
MQVSGPARGPSCSWRRSMVCGCFFVFLFPIHTRGQDAAEAARQEKARKVEEHKAPAHVYTDEDLKQKKILTREDQAGVDARKGQQNAATGEQDAKQTSQEPNDPNVQGESLGEIARRYRQEKAAREAELAARKKIAPFPYAMPDNSLAAPRPGVGPLAGADVIDWPIIPPRRPAVRPLPPTGGSSAHGRISPFQPRPFVSAPAAPPIGLVVRPEPVRPAARPVTPVHPAEKAGIATPAIQGTKRIEVQRGQSWWKLAEVYLGNGARWTELRALNPDTDGPRELLKLGSIVLVPAGENARDGSTPETVTVEKGDSLWSLARKHLGRGSAWSCLTSANPEIVDYARLMIGTTVHLPQGDALQSCRELTGARK